MTLGLLRIVDNHLKTIGADGLVNTESGCACEVGDLSPGRCFDAECEPARKMACPPDCQGMHEFCEGECGFYYTPFGKGG